MWFLAIASVLALLTAIAEGTIVSANEPIKEIIVDITEYCF